MKFVGTEMRSMPMNRDECGRPEIKKQRVRLTSMDSLGLAISRNEGMIRQEGVERPRTCAIATCLQTRTTRSCDGMAHRRKLPFSAGLRTKNGNPQTGYHGALLYY
uniref:Uncharacterized protein n=1 Tax=Panagrellus redivivus TaxID=6233 RepID=A0A7E4ZRF4_PANRE